MRQFFRKHQRITSNEEFREVLSHHCCTGRGKVRVYAWPSRFGQSRLGISISRREGNAVARNRIKRLVREAFRLEQHNLPGPFDYLLIFGGKKTNKKGGAGKEQISMQFDEMRQLFVKLARRSAEKARVKAEDQS